MFFRILYQLHIRTYAKSRISFNNCIAVIRFSNVFNHILISFFIKFFFDTKPWFNPYFLPSFKQWTKKVYIQSLCMTQISSSALYVTTYCIREGKIVFYCDSELLFCFVVELYIGEENQQVNITIEILWKISWTLFKLLTLAHQQISR